MRVVSRVVCVSFLAAAMAVAGSASAQSDPTVDVIKVNGLLDDRLTAFVSAALEELAESGTRLAVIQVDSPGAVQDSVFDLLDVIEEPPVPLAVWVGPEPAVAFGGAARILMAAPIRAAAPLVTIGHTEPVVAGQPPSGRVGPLPDEAQAVEGPIPGVVDIVQPSLSQLVADLDGTQVQVGGETVILDTVIEDTDEEGNPVVHPAPTTFREPGLGTRLLRLGASPDTALFFLVLGLAVAAFEYYALGPGLAAATAAVSILLAGYGLAVLPLTAWAVPAVVAGMLAMTAQFQLTGRPGMLTLPGIVLVILGGVFFTAAEPQFGTSALAVALTASVAVFFIAVALPAVTKARLSTATIGREYLVGRTGTASGAFTSGEGVVEIEAASWRAHAHREAALKTGDQVVVTAVRGVFVEVEPLPNGVAKTK